MAERFYCPDAPLQGRLRLGPEESRHLALVRRLKVGETVEVFDGRGAGCLAQVEEIGKNQATLRVISTLPETSMSLDLTLATAVPKGDRFDWLVEKATELGVSRLVPLLTRRSTVDPRPAKQERLRRLVIEASKQCRRNRLMGIAEPNEWKHFLEGTSGTNRVSGILAHPMGEPLARVALEPAIPVVVAIGPEGGFTAEEVDEARSQGWAVVSLGPTILRIETAALAACAVLLARSHEG